MNHVAMWLLLFLWTRCALLEGSEVPCSPMKGSVVWLEDPENRSVTVEWGNSELMCNSSHSCKDGAAEVDNELPVQLLPVVIQHGVTFRLNPTARWQSIPFTLLKTDEAGFNSCNKSHVIPVVPGFTSGSIVIPSAHLENGWNFFILESTTNMSVRCDNGYRLNVTVRGHNCSPEKLNRKCSGKGHCTASHNQLQYTCTCCTGYSGDECQNCLGDTCNGNDICAGATCQNGGTCKPRRKFPSGVQTNDTTVDYEDIIVLESVSTNNTSSGSPDTSSESDYECVCLPNYTGQYCETRLNDCTSNPCINGICVERPIMFQCYCIPGYHGQRCEEEYNECLSSPCKNGAVCVDRVDQYECSCTHGYRGVHCETKIDLCRPNACHNATCQDKGDYYRCLCPPGKTGSHCEFNLDECASNPCHNDGTCLDLEDGYECVCPIAFAGVHCEYMMDVFAPPLEGAELNGQSHIHNLYIVAGTLSGAILIVILVLTGCYCKMHETYKQLSWRRMRYKKKSLSCSNLDTCHDVSSVNKPRLSVDAIWEATSLCYDNASYDTPLNQSLHTRRI